MAEDRKSLLAVLLQFASQVVIFVAGMTLTSGIRSSSVEAVGFELVTSS